MTETKQMTSLFANKADLIASQSRVKELEKEITALKSSPLGAQLTAAKATITLLTAENTALKSRPLAVTATKAATAPAKVSPAPAKVSTAPAAKPITAEEYRSTLAPKMTMTIADFNTLTTNEKNLFIKQGGKLTPTN